MLSAEAAGSQVGIQGGQGQAKALCRLQVGGFSPAPVAIRVGHDELVSLGLIFLPRSGGGGI